MHQYLFYEHLIKVQLCNNLCSVALQLECDLVLGVLSASVLYRSFECGVCYTEVPKNLYLITLCMST